MSSPTRQATPPTPMNRPSTRRESSRSSPIAVTMTAAISGTTASSRPVVELVNCVSA